MEGLVGEIDTELRQHELFKLLKEPFAANAFDIVGSVYIDCHIG